MWCALCEGYLNMTFVMAVRVTFVKVVRVIYVMV